MDPALVSAIRADAGRKGAAARWGRRGSLPSADGSDLRPRIGRDPGRRDGRADWCRIENATANRAQVYIYDEIGWFGITAQEFVDELAEITAGTIELHLNSPGGDMFDGIAIFNTLVSHRARVEVMVDGLAASAASVIAMAGDRIVMGRGTQMMIHEAWGICAGPAGDMRAMANRLDQSSDNIAGFYAVRAGGSAASWRERMHAETWYTADEAVKAGLADDVAAGDESRESPENRWDLSIFTYAGRRHAPAPDLSLAPAPHPANHAEPEPEPPPACDDGPFAFDKGLFHTLLTEAVRTAPAPPDVTARQPEPDPFQYDPERFRRSVLEALTS
jgi:ATP-dependent protease ClpP protease subunit